jgi:ADP-ribose pyrophosphatase YjhB (NUDIX family)
MQINRFNIRVYGLLLNEKNEVLVCDETIKGHPVTKFPGGGLEFGEGTKHCLEREFMEETALRVKVVEHFYTTDFFQQSAYNPSHQIISIYYLVERLSEETEALSQYDFTGVKEKDLEFRWLPAKGLSAADFTLPIDKKVAEMIAAGFS